MLRNRCGRFAARILMITTAAIAAAVPVAMADGVVLTGKSSQTTLPTWQDRYDWPQGHGAVGWDARQPAGGGYALTTGTGDAAGLWAAPLSGRHAAPARAGWAFRAPGTTRIATATVQLQFAPRVLAHHCVRVALEDAAGEPDAQEFCRPPGPVAGQGDVEVRLGDAAPNPTSTVLAVSLVLPCDKPQATACAKQIGDVDPARDSIHVRVVDMVLVDDDAPVVTPSGPFFALDGTYIDGRQTYGLRVDARDAGAGVTRIDIDHEGWPGPQPRVGDRAAACDPTHRAPELGSRLCPEADALALDVDTQPMPEGTRRFRAWAQDVAANVGDRRWTVIIDRTPPPAPQLSFTTPGEGAALPTWSTVGDPDLPDGTPGSGLAGYRVRHRIADGDWSAWEALGTDAQSGGEILDQPDGTQVAFQVVAVDAVGNRSEPAEIDGRVLGDAPDVTVAGALADVEGDFVGDPTGSLTIAADDGDGVGVRRLLLRRGDTTLYDSGDVCVPAPLAGPDDCPATAERGTTIDLSSMPEGQNDLSAVAIDRAGNEDYEPLQIFIDRTAPAAPSDFALTPYDAEARQVDLVWHEGDDPALPDGSEGAGVEQEQYRVLRDGAWSDWSSIDDPDVALSAIALGDVVTIEARAVDAAGNVSASSTATLTVTEEGTGDQVGDTDEGGLDDAAGLAAPRTASLVTAQSSSVFSNCTPMIKFARTQNKPADYDSFVPVTTRLGAQVGLNCYTLSNVDRIRIRVAFAYKIGDHTYKRFGGYGEGGQDDYFEKVIDDPKAWHQYAFNGLNTPCAPEVGGRHKWILVGDIKYYRSWSLDVTREFPYALDKPQDYPLTCPTAAEREARALSGWRHLAHRAARPDEDGRIQTGRPRDMLKLALDRPSVPEGVRRAWEAHHIVPWKDPQARDLQVLMFRCRVHPNEERNGIYLRGSGLARTRKAWHELAQTHPDLAARTYHADTFFDEYVRIVRRTIPDDVLNTDEHCGGRARPWLLDALASVKTDLDNGNLGVETGR